MRDGMLVCESHGTMVIMLKTRDAWWYVGMWKSWYDGNYVVATCHVMVCESPGTMVIML